LACERSAFANVSNQSAISSKCSSRAAFVSGLPLFNKPLKMRLDLLDQAFALMQPGAPFVQFTYNAISPIPRSHDGIRAEASGRVWRNFPPARVWVYRRMSGR